MNNFYQFLLRFGISGIIINVLGFLFYIFLLEFFNFPPIIALSISSPVIICSYYLSQCLFVFRKKLSVQNLSKFLLNFLLFFLLNIFLLSVFTENSNLNPIIIQLFILIFLNLLNFFIQKKLIFN